LLLGIISFHCSRVQGKQALFHIKVVYEPVFPYSVSGFSMLYEEGFSCYNENNS
jgi:hypothetical protein